MALAPALSRLRASPDVRFYILEDGGVLFCDGSQELHGFNTAAAYIWCCLEEGLDAREAASAFARVAALPEAEAYGLAADLVQQWIGRGWLTSAADSEGAAPAPPRGRRPPRPTAPTPQRIARRVRGEPALRYRLLGTTFGLRVTEPRLAALVEPVLAHLEVRGAEAHDLELEVARDAGGLVLLEDGAVVARCAEPAELAPLLKAHLRVRVVDRHRYFMQIHAGAVLAGEACMLLPGPPGSGKSTLTAGLVASGLGYLSDELALLEGIPLAIRAVPLALTVKPGAVDVLEPLYPGLAGLPVHRREDGKQVRYLPPPASALAADAAAHPLNWIVFPRYTPGVETQLRAALEARGPRAPARLLPLASRVADTG